MTVNSKELDIVIERVETHNPDITLSDLRIVAEAAKSYRPAMPVRVKAYELECQTDHINERDEFFEFLRKKYVNGLIVEE